MLPTHFRWVWYLVGLAGMVLTVVGIVAILGSAADLGILVPVVVVGAVAIWYVIARFRRSLDAAVANAPSQQAKAPSNAASAAADPEPAPAPDQGRKMPPGDPPRTSRR